MRCPKCRCEVGNQPVCPFCGATVYMSNTTWKVNDVARQATVPVHGGAQLNNSRGIERKLRELETKLNLLMVLQAGTLLLAILILLAMALM